MFDSLMDEQFGKLIISLFPDPIILNSMTTGSLEALL